MAKRAKPLPTPDWAGGLPPELLASVFEHLTDTDHVRLASVCTSWRAAIKDLHRRPAVLCPWAVLSRPLARTEEEEEEEGDDDDDDDAHVSLHFFRPFDGKTHTTRHALSPDYRPVRFVGMSPDGWLVFVNQGRELRALNPVTGARMRLPRLRTIPKGYPKRCDKVAMSSPRFGGPRHRFFIAFLRNWRQKSVVAFARAGDKKWSLVDTSMLQEIYDLAYHDGSFYIFGWMPGGSTGEMAGVMGGKLQPEIVVIGSVCKLDFGPRLVSSASGDLLQVRHSYDGKYTFYRLELRRGGDGRMVVRYVPLRDLGDQAVLLASESSLLVSTVQVPQLRKNCVYSVDNRLIKITKFDSRRAEFLRFGRCIEAAWFMPGVL